MSTLQHYVEAIIFATDHPTTEREIRDCLVAAFEWDMDIAAIQEVIGLLKEKYQKEEFAFELVKSGGGYQFMTKSEYHPIVAHFLNVKSKRKLSAAALETLAIVAYKQPITKSEIEQIRGVNCDYTISKLMEKDLLELVGRAHGPGRPLLYGTSGTFMDHFGINGPEDLPKLKEILPQSENEIGATTIEEQPNNEQTPQQEG